MNNTTNAGNSFVTAKTNKVIALALMLTLPVLSVSSSYAKGKGGDGGGDHKGPVYEVVDSYSVGGNPHFPGVKSKHSACLSVTYPQVRLACLMP